MAHSKKQLISVVLSAYNEEKNIPLIYQALSKVFSVQLKKYKLEIIFVNDGSQDNSYAVLNVLASQNKQVKIIDFSRNFGQQNAIEAGLKYATGNAVIMMDADLQHPPKLIPKMIEAWTQGYDIVNTCRKQSKKENLIKKITSRGFYWLFNKISNIKINSGFADFRLLDRKVVETLNNLPEKRKFFRGLINWVGYKSTYLEYEAQARINGRTSYTFRKMMSLARIGITSFSMRPMKLILLAGVTISFISFVFLLVMVYYRYFIDFKSFSSLSFVIVFIVFNTGILLVCQGIIAMYLINIYEGMQDRPSYIIKGKINF